MVSQKQAMYRLVAMTQVDQKTWSFAGSGTHNYLTMPSMTTYFLLWGTEYFLILRQTALVTFQPSCKHSAACFQQLQFHHKGPTNERNAK